jgi:hypothetical protein
MVEALNPEDLRVVLDLNGLPEGNYQIEPDVSVSQGQPADANISVLPAEIDVVITPRAEATETLDNP